jgi:high-affinity iron transporter
MWLTFMLLACGQGTRTDDLPAPIQQAMAQDLPDELSAGRLAFRTHCAGCHGADAAGDGPASAALADEPGALAITSRDPVALRRTIERGVPGTAMQGFGSLDDSDLDAVAGWLASLPPPAAVEGE